MWPRWPTTWDWHVLLWPVTLAAALLSSLGPVSAPGIFKGLQPANRMGLKVGRWMPFPLWRLAMQAFYGKAGQHAEVLFPDPDNQPHTTPARGAFGCKKSSFRFTCGAGRKMWMPPHKWGNSSQEKSPPAA